MTKRAIPTEQALAKSKGPLFARVAAVSLLAALLASCNVFTDDNIRPAACPVAGVLTEGERLERYLAGSERELTDLRLRAKVDGVRHVCSIRVKERDLTMDIAFEVTTERGPATAAGETLSLSYFAAVVGPNQTILSRSTFPLEVTFPGTARQAQFTEQLEVNVPIAANNQVSDYSVFIGLQLSQEELQRVLDANK